MGFLDTLFGGGEAKSESTSRSEPWAPLQPFIKSVAQEAHDRLYEEPPQYHGPVHAPMTSDQNAGLDMLRRYSGQMQGQIVDPTFTAYRQMIADPMDVADTPGLQALQDAFARRTGQQFQDYIMPQMQASGAGLGHRGSSRMDLARGLAGDRAQQSIADNNASLLNNAYNARLNQQTNALGQANNMALLGAQPGQTRYNVGQAYQTDAQNALNAEYQRWMGNQELGMQSLMNYGNLAQGLGSLGGTQQQTGTQEQPSQGIFGPILGGLGLASGIGSLATGIGGLFGASSALGAGATGLATGGFNPLLSAGANAAGSYAQTPFNSMRIPGF